MEKVWRAERTATIRLWNENENNGSSCFVIWELSSSEDPTRSSNRAYIYAG